MTQRNSNASLAYRRDIDGLRAVAVLSVLAFHVSPGRFKGGFVGVDVFFVISGFLISSIIYNQLETGAFSIVEFYIRRIRRIFPALLLVLIAVGATGWLLLLPSQFLRLGKQMIGGSTFVANFVLWRQSGYFTWGSDRIPLLHLWSLGVEEQYYLVFPLICIAFYRARARWKLPATYVAIGLVSMALNVAFVKQYSAATYFLPHSRLWELFLGAGLALCLHRNLQPAWEVRLLTRWRNGMGFVGLLLIAIAAFWINQDDPFPGWWALLPTLGAVLVISAGESSWSNRVILSSKPAVWIGLISYPLYLWHWPIFSFASIANVYWGLTTTPTLKAGMIAASFILAYLTYQFIELPIRNEKLKSRRRKGAVLLLGGVGLIGVFGLLVLLSAGFPARMPPAVVALDHDYESEAWHAWHQGHCMLELGESASAFGIKCTDPSKGDPAQPLIFVWGDSHAADLVPGFRALQVQSGVRLAQYTASGCIPIVGLPMREQRECLGINDAVLGYIRQLRPDTVVLSGQWDWHFLHDPEFNPGMLVHTIELVKAAGVRRVVVIGSAPEWKIDVPGMLITQLRRHPGIAVPQRLDRNLLKAHDERQVEEPTEKSGAVYVSLFDNLCDQDTCISATGSGAEDVVTMDAAHFTEHGSVLVATRIWSSILTKPNSSSLQ